MSAAAIYGVAVYSRERDAFWRMGRRPESGSAWTCEAKEATVFTDDNSGTATERAMPHLLRLRRKGWDVLLVFIPTADYHSRQNSGDGGTDLPHRNE